MSAPVVCQHCGSGNVDIKIPAKGNLYTLKCREKGCGKTSKMKIA